MSRNNRQEDLMMEFAGNLTHIYLETISCMIGVSDVEAIRVKNKILLAIRDAELQKVDAIEKSLGISPTTAEIRKWFKKEKRLNDGEDWIRDRS